MEENKQDAEETEIGNKGDTGGKQKRQSQESVPPVVLCRCYKLSYLDCLV